MFSQFDPTSSHPANYSAYCFTVNFARYDWLDTTGAKIRPAQKGDLIH